jgi:hypothetical protein
MPKTLISKQIGHIAQFHESGFILWVDLEHYFGARETVSQRAPLRSGDCSEDLASIIVDQVGTRSRHGLRANKKPRPIAGRGTSWHGTRGPKSAPIEGVHQLFGFLTIAAIGRPGGPNG